MGAVVKPIALVLVIAALGCGPSKSPDGTAATATDSATVVVRRNDSTVKASLQQATALRTDAESDMRALYKDPATVVLDSLRIVQPPEKDGRLPAMAACGVIKGRKNGK